MTRAQLGSIQRLEKGRYRISVEGERNDLGKRYRKSKVVRGSREDAEIELAKMKLSMGKSVEMDMTVSAFWRAVYEPSLVTVRENTKYNYTYNFEKYIEPRFGSINLSELTAKFIERRLWEIEKPGAQRSAYAVFRQIVNYAYADSYIDDNPFLRRIKLRPKKHYEPSAFTLSEIQGVVDAVRDENIEPIIICMLFGGLRREEACALFWEDISIVDGMAYISVTKGYQCVKEKAVEVEPKTPKSVRLVFIAPPISGRLEELGVVAKATADCAGLKAPLPLVPNINNERMNPNVVAKRWREICKTGSLKNVPMKNLRTSYATALKQAGQDNASISQLLAHTNLSTAYDHYFAVNAEAQIETARMFAKRVTSCNIPE